MGNPGQYRRKQWPKTHKSGNFSKPHALITGSSGIYVTHGVILILSTPWSPTTCRGRQLVGSQEEGKCRVRQPRVALCSFTAARAH